MTDFILTYIIFILKNYKSHFNICHLFLRYEAYFSLFYGIFGQLRAKHFFKIFQSSFIVPFDDKINYSIH